MQGWRVHHEDAHALSCPGALGTFFVLDGHGGEKAAELGSGMLLEEITGAAAGLGESAPLLADDLIEAGFCSVDERLRQEFKAHPDKDSGCTVTGAVLMQRKDGTYDAKLMNAGDSRALLLRGPREAAGDEKLVRLPAHIAEHFSGRAREADGSDAYPRVDENGCCSLRFPLVAETTDHKPNFPTEKARIEAAGGHVSEEEPPRLDGNLAVSRGLGDFEYKQDASKPPGEQKASCVPDIYAVSGLSAESVLVLACDGVWDVLTSEAVADVVRKRLAEDSHADLGDVAAEIIRTSLRNNSRDNVTVMLVQLVDGSDWISGTDEMQEFQHLHEMGGSSDEEVNRHYHSFLTRCEFALRPQPCDVCQRWYRDMHQCPCKTVCYCTRQCQKKGWKKHKPNCPSAVPGES